MRGDQRDTELGAVRATDVAGPTGMELARVSSHGLGNRFARVLWGIVSLILFRPSPRFMHRWRNLLLRMFGANLHKTARVYSRARVWGPWNLHMDEGACIGDDVDVYSVDRIRIGAWATVSQYSYLCAASHDYTDPAHPLITAPIEIGARCWIAADVFIGPGVKVGAGTVVGARSAVFRDLPEWVVANGTPARVIRQRTLKSDSGREIEL